MSPRTTTIPTKPEEESGEPAEPLTAAQLKRIYHDPNSIVPDHTLDDLVQGLKRCYGFKTE